MQEIKVKTHPSSALLKKEDQLAWKIAEIAVDKSRPSAETIEMVINRICYLGRTIFILNQAYS